MFSALASFSSSTAPAIGIERLTEQFALVHEVGRCFAAEVGLGVRALLLGSCSAAARYSENGDDADLFPDRPGLRLMPRNFLMFSWAGCTPFS
jgi:hypothetical protein